MPKDQIKSPFKFLDAYQHDDRHIFFGREQETDELGKTSLINCGLSNEFEASDWFPIFIRRRDNILTAWKEKLQEKSLKKLKEAASLIELIRSLYLDYFKPIYLIFDQFEELFILGDKEEQESFFQELDELLNAGVQCKVIISMREEYIAHLSDYEYIIPNLFDNRIRLEKMGSRNLKEVIIKTVSAYEIQIDDPEEVTDMIIKKLRDKNNQIDLATLQVYLDRLYRMDVKRRGSSKRTIKFDKALIEETGDLENVMGHFLEEQLRTIEQELEKEQKITEKDIPLNILFALVTDNGTKQAVELENIKQQLKRAKNIDPIVVDYCVTRFKEMRIIRELSK